MEVLKYIDYLKKLFEENSNLNPHLYFNRGGCYEFARLLKNKFPSGKIAVTKELMHVLFYYKKKYYDVDGVYNIINAVINILTKVMTIVCIGIFIIWQSKDMAVVLLMLSVLCLVVIQTFFRKRMRQNGIIRRNLQYETNTHYINTKGETIQ